MKDLNLGNAKVPPDLLPSKPEERNWGIYSFFALWIGMDIGIPTYYLASSLISGGMNLPWAMITILLANVIIAFPSCPYRGATRGHLQGGLKGGHGCA